MENKKPKKETKLSIEEIVSQGFDGIKEKLTGIEKRLDDNDKKIETITTGKDERFKEGVKVEDIKSAEAGREGVDKRIVKIVDDILGKDFGIEFGKAEGLGMKLTIIVPERLSLVPNSERPTKDEQGKYKRDPNDRIINEVYKPQDRRSRSMATGSDFGIVRKHCEKVLANIVSTYNKLHKPLPEFKITRYN